MSLRTKILTYVVVLMSIVFVMVLATILPDTLLFPKLRVNAAVETVTALSATLEQLSADERRDLLASHPNFMREQNLLDGWALVDPESRVQAWLLPEARPQVLTPELVQSLGLDIVSAVRTKDGQLLIVHARSRRGNSAMDLWRTLTVMVLGTLLLVMVLYFLLLRLIVKPVERLAKASHTSTASRILQPVPHTDRADEIGELIRAYNAMAAEVNDLRMNLEKRVHQATEELQAAQTQIVASERLSAAGRMAAGVAHEISNPLGGMLNAARTLRSKTQDGGREAEYLDMIQEGLTRIQSIVTTMLQFSRPAQQVAPVNLKDVMDGALMFCKHRVEKMGVEVHWESSLQEAPVLYGRRSELGQVFLNLVVNALDAMEARPGTAHRLTLGLAGKDGVLLASVRDTGAGMSPDVKEKAGQFFFTTKGEGKGTGLGLSVVNHIVVQSGGRVTIESLEGQGTTITVELPLNRPMLEGNPTAVPAAAPQAVV